VPDGIPLLPGLRVHAEDPRSRANGPGTRYVVWLQGCTLGCPGCFNPATHPGEGGTVRHPLAVIGDALAAKVDGLSISGGEPMQQPEAVYWLLEAAREAKLSTLMFSGYTIDEIRALPRGPEILERLDVLVDGRYVAAERLGKGLRGSTNQVIHVLSPRHTRAEVEATPVAEVVISPTGEVSLTGVDPLKLKR
jgi:anaerobic ribonucleoside-triphosphate reductase activating protein